MFSDDISLNMHLSLLLSLSIFYHSLHVRSKTIFHNLCGIAAIEQTALLGERF